MRSRTRLYLALALFVVGIAGAIGGSRLLSPKMLGQPARNTDPEAGGPLIDVAAIARDPTTLTGFRDSIVRQLRDDAGLPGHVDDLAQAASSLVQLLCAGDDSALEVHLAEAAGVQFSDEGLEHARLRWRRFRESTVAGGLQVDGIQAMPLIIRGTVVNRPALRGDQIVTESRWLDGESVRRDRLSKRNDLTVVEITVPLRQRDLVSGQERSLRAGYRFVWDEQRLQWMPFNSVRYIDDAKVQVQGLPL